MKTRISVITRNLALFRLVGRRKTSLCPKEHVRDSNLDVRAILHKNNDSSCLSKILLDSIHEYNQCLLIVDECIESCDVLSSDSFAKVYFSNMTFEKKGENYIRRQVSIGIKRLKFFEKIMNDAKTQKIALLPKNNFISNELDNLLAAASGNLERGEIIPEIEKNIADLIKRVRPKRKSNRADKYIVDDRNLHFSYGFEHHALPETSTPPHNESCITRSRLRFGCEYDFQRHYNVSAEGKVRLSGDFKDCHGESRTFRNATHLNIFPNDHIA